MFLLVLEVCHILDLPFPETNSSFTPENGWLENEFALGARPIFRGEMLVSGACTPHPGSLVTHQDEIIFLGGDPNRFNL